MGSRKITSLSSLYGQYTKKDFQDFIDERESIRKKKEAGQPWPWSSDEILNTYKFTNINRFDDRMTKVIISRYDDILSLAYARTIQREEVIVDGLDKKTVEKYDPVFLQIYQVPAQVKMGEKNYIDGMYKHYPRVFIHWQPQKNILDNLNYLSHVYGWKNNFIFQQALLDYAYLHGTIDINSDVYIGPGARPATRLIDDWPDLPPYILEHAQCEWRKYLELKHGIRKGADKLKYKRKEDEE
jgi:hypothetical protein